MASIFKRKRNGRPYGKWLIAYVNENGTRRVIVGGHSKTVAVQLANSLEDEVALRKRGIIDVDGEHRSEAERMALIVKTKGKDGGERITGGHLADFHADIIARGKTVGYADTIRARAAEIIGRAKARRISGLKASVVQRVLGELREADLSAQTCNHYLRAIKQFTRWLRRDKRTAEDALEHLKGYNVEADRRRVRRALDDGDFNRLIDKTEKGLPHRKMSGPERAMLYRLAANTGFRANELRSLTPESFDLDGETPMVTVQAGYSKRGRRDEQPIRADLADLLRVWLVDKAPGRPVFNMPDRTAVMLRRDLAVAEIPDEDSAGRVFDFHALRGQYITSLVKSGASVKVAQELARHSDPKLTMNVYTHLSVPDKKKALEAMPAVTKGTPKKKRSKSAS